MSGIYGITQSYLPQLLSHQTGLSITASTAYTFYAIGSSISVPRNGIAVISMVGHVNNASSEGYIQLKLTRGSNSFLFGYGNGSYPNSLFGNMISYNNQATITGIIAPTPLSTIGNFNYSGSSSGASTGAQPYFLLPVYSGDSLQFYATNNTSGDITYIDDLLVMLI